MAQYNVKGIECVRSCDQKKYLHNEKKRGICINQSLIPKRIFHSFQMVVSFAAVFRDVTQHSPERNFFFVYFSNMAAVTLCEHTLYIVTILSSLTTHERKFLSCLIKVMNSTSASMPPGPFSNILPAYFSLWQTQ